MLKKKNNNKEGFFWFLQRSSKLPLRPVLTYIFFGSCWILFSDQILGAMKLEREIYVQISMYKGWMFIGVTAVLLYMIIAKDYRKMSDLNADLSMKNEELTSSNEEIHALYEEMSASEEALHENFNELQAYRNKLEESDERYRLVLMASQEGFWDFRVREQQLEVSEGFCRILGYSYDERNMLEADMFSRIHPEDRYKAQWLLDTRALRERDIRNYPVRLLNKEGNYRWVLSNAIIIKDDKGEPIRVIGAHKDIHEEMLQRERVEHYAFHDPATGFYNRDYLIDTIRRYISENCTGTPKIKLLAVGVPSIKRITSIYGLNIAEVVHYQVGMALKAAFSQTENIGVLSQGRFGILFEQAWEEGTLERCIEQLETALSVPIWVNQVDVSVSLAYGLATPTEGDSDPDRMLQQAETAMEYGVENPGGTRVVSFEPRMQEEREYLGRVEHLMKRAVENNEFHLVYQPQLGNTVLEGILGYEALLRWNSPELGFVPPDVFIPLAESEGHIEGIGQFVVREACRFIRDYTDVHGVPARVSVNASFLELMNIRYIEQLARHTEAYGVAPELISIEITETAISQYMDAVIDNLQILRDVGFEVHLDDFGTGYSSLNHLGRLPVNMLKVDRSFVWELENSPRQRSLVELIIRVAHQLEMKVCAEGVETENQFKMLQGMGCDVYQGYLFSKPLKEETLLSVDWDSAPLWKGIHG